MVSDTQAPALDVNEAIRLRQQASDLLQRLTFDREQSERRFADSGKRDPLKFITGRTSLENAIASTREMISNMDSLLAQLNADLNPGRHAEANGYTNGERAAIQTAVRSHERAFSARTLRDIKQRPQISAVSGQV